MNVGAVFLGWGIGQAIGTALGISLWWCWEKWDERRQARRRAKDARENEEYWEKWQAARDLDARTEEGRLAAKGLVPLQRSLGKELTGWSGNWVW